MRVLVTGSSGYLGQHFLNELLQRPESNDISAVYRSMDGFEDAVRSHPIVTETKSNIHCIKLDLTSETDVDEYFNNADPFDICFHLAAIASPKVCQQDPGVAKAANVPVYFFDKLKNIPVIALSTDQVYCGTKAPYTEDKGVGPINTYAQTKIDMEKFLLSSTASKPRVCLRSSIILGAESPFGKSHSTFLHFCKSREGVDTTFYTDECRSVISVLDVCHTLSHFLNTVQKGDEVESNVYNMGGPARVSRLDMAMEVANNCGFDSSVFIPAEKSMQAPEENDVPSPLDITMSSTKLEKLVGRKFMGLEKAVNNTFA